MHFLVAKKITFGWKAIRIHFESGNGPPFLFPTAANHVMEMPFERVVLDGHFFGGEYA